MIASENPITHTLVSENETHGQQISNKPSILPYSCRRRVKLSVCGGECKVQLSLIPYPQLQSLRGGRISQKPNSRWCLKGHLSDLNIINRVTHFSGSQSNQHQPLTTKSVHMQRLGQTPTLNDYLLLILSIYLAMITNVDMMIKLLELSKNIV